MKAAPAAASASSTGAPSLARASTELVAGFLPLLDCALLVVAREKGFARAHGLDLRLMRDVSWAAVRDRLAIGGVDAAQTPAPLPIAATLGLGPLQVEMAAPMALGQGGNAVTVSRALAELMSAHGEITMDPARAGAALRGALAARRAQGLPPPAFGVVHPFSSHNYELRYWLSACGVAPDEDVRIIVLPPQFMPDALAAGGIDGYCVGEPWNSVSVARGTGAIVATKSRIWPASLEKALSLRADMLARQPDAAARLVDALRAAAVWADERAHVEELAALLARPEYLDLPPHALLPGLTGRLRMAFGEAHEPDFLSFADGTATHPSIIQALWLFAQMARWGHAQADAQSVARARAVFRPDLHDRLRARPDGAPEPALRVFDRPPMGLADVEALLTAGGPADARAPRAAPPPEE